MVLFFYIGTSTKDLIGFHFFVTSDGHTFKQPVSKERHLSHLKTMLEFQISMLCRASINKHKIHKNYSKAAHYFHPETI